MRKLILPVIVIMLVVSIWRQCSPLTHPHGQLVRKDPEQIKFTKPQPEIKLAGWILQPLAVFTVEARVLGKQAYSDFPAAICPYDLALGWGVMSDTALLEKLDISQRSRFYYWRYWGELPVKEAEVISHSANMHLIPADDGVRKTIAGLREGSVVKISGYLVDARHPEVSAPWRSSLKRDDAGAGACEIIYVKAISER